MFITRGNKMKEAGAMSEKKLGLTALFSHLPDSSVMPFRLCNYLQQTTRKFFFSVKYL